LPLEIGITVAGILFIIRNKVDVPKAPPKTKKGGGFCGCCSKKPKKTSEYDSDESDGNE